MDVNKIKAFIEKLDEAIKKGSKEAYDFFHDNWEELDLTSKEIIRYLLITHYISSLLSKVHSVEDKIYYVGILNLADKTTNREVGIENESISKLILNKDVDKKQLAKIFYKLKSKNHILSTKEQIAEAMALIFDISPNTAYSYLTDVSRLDNTDDLI